MKTAPVQKVKCSICGAETEPGTVHQVWGYKPKYRDAVLIKAHATCAKKYFEEKGWKFTVLSWKVRK